jgi:hypothetical protein
MLAAHCSAGDAATWVAIYAITGSAALFVLFIAVLVAFYTTYTIIGNK